MFIFCFFLNGKKWCDRSWYVCLPVYTNGCQTPPWVSHTEYMYRSQFPVSVSVGRESGGGVELGVCVNISVYLVHLLNSLYQLLC